ncbi:MAG: TadE/TadG family type IV pilus assembly protein [Candidatus Nanopelagicales bacterium]
MSSNDDGSAIVEFVLVSILVVVLALALIQLAVALHVRNTLVSASAEGARFAAAADRSPEEGAGYTADLISQTLPSAFASDVSAGYEDVGGIPTIVVEVRTQLPLFGWVGPAGTLVVRGHAMEESP